jgi:hypothetical protein
MKRREHRSKGPVLQPGVNMKIIRMLLLSVCVAVLVLAFKIFM